MNWIETFKCRCSGIHKIMANSRSNSQLTEKQAEKLAEYRKKIDRGMGLTSNMTLEYNEFCEKEKNSGKIILGDTCIEYLMEVYALETRGMISVMKEMSEVAQMEKGKAVEESCIKLLSIVDGIMYFKNDRRVENDYLIGEPDVGDNDDIMKATLITDIKAAFDYPIFLKKINQDLQNGNKQQVQGYCDITGATRGRISHCLESMPPAMQENYYRQIRNKLLNSGEYVSEESPQFIRDLERIWDLLQRSMNFDHIPHHQRVFNIPVTPFTKFEQQAVYDRVKVCREWLSNFDEQYRKLNLPTEEFVDSDKIT